MTQSKPLLVAGRPAVALRTAFKSFSCRGGDRAAAVARPRRALGAVLGRPPRANAARARRARTPPWDVLHGATETKSPPYPHHYLTCVAGRRQQRHHSQDHSAKQPTADDVAGPVIVQHDQRHPTDQPGPSCQGRPDLRQQPQHQRPGHHRVRRMPGGQDNPPACTATRAARGANRPTSIFNTCPNTPTNPNAPALTKPGRHEPDRRTASTASTSTTVTVNPRCPNSANARTATRPSNGSSQWLSAAARTRRSKRVAAGRPSTPARSTTNPAARTTSSTAATTRRVLKWPPPTPTAARGGLQPAGLTSSPALAADRCVDGGNSRADRTEATPAAARYDGPLGSTRST